MARYTARTLAETNRILKLIKAKNQQLVRSVQSSLPRTLLGAGFIISTRAKEIITEKGHVDTGNLRRSINAQLSRADEQRAEVLVGSFVIYARKIENLPDGGYLYPASVETMPQQVAYLEKNGVRPALVEWGR